MSPSTSKSISFLDVFSIIVFETANLLPRCDKGLFDFSSAIAGAVELEPIILPDKDRLFDVDVDVEADMNLLEDLFSVATST